MAPKLGNLLQNLSRILGFCALLAAAGAASGQTPNAQTRMVKQMEELRAELASLNAAHTSTARELKDIKTKLDDTGWKALDLAAQLSSAQWAMFGTGLAILGLFLTVAAFGAYQGVVRLVETKLNAAAEQAEEHLRDGIRKEEARIRDELDKSVKAVMEVTRLSALARMYGTISHAFWEQHNRATGASDAEVDEKRRNLETAIHLSRQGMEAAAKAGQDERLLTSLQSNTAYYLAEFSRFVTTAPKFAQLFRPKDREEALRLAELVREKARPAMAQEQVDEVVPDQLENACWVLWSLGDEAQKNAANELIRWLYEHPKSSQEMKTWIVEKYYENKKPA